MTQFGRMCAKLGIEVIAASSPQAKGRVERMHGRHQDRLVKKLRRQKITTHAQANAYLEAEYLPEHNRRSWRISSGWRANGRSARIGWCVTTTAPSNCRVTTNTGERPGGGG